MREPSLFLRLFLTTTGLLVVLFIIATLIFIKWEYYSFRYDSDRELVSDAVILWKLTKENMDANKKMEEIDFSSLAPSLSEKYRSALSQYTQGRNFRIWKQQKLMLRSNAAEPETAPAAAPDFSEKRIGNNTWRTYALYVSDDQAVIEMSENTHEIDALIAKSVRGILYIGLTILPLLIVTIFFSLRYGLRSMTEMASYLRQRSPDDLQAVKIPALPRELKPLQQSLNLLLDQLKGVLARERRLIDDAAHELRTPLAGIQIHAQLAAAAVDQDDRTECMTELFAAIKRANSVIEQLLALSRISAEHVEIERISVYPIMRQALADRAFIAAEKEIQLSLEGDENLEQTSHAGLMAILIGVLLDNAIKFTPTSGKVSVKVLQHAIEISDTGPGILPSEREKVFERFYRGKGHTNGNGLGLAIARQICLILKIRMELSTPKDSHGLLIKLIAQKS